MKKKTEPKAPHPELVPVLVLTVQVKDTGEVPLMDSVPLKVMIDPSTAIPEIVMLKGAGPVATNEKLPAEIVRVKESPFDKVPLHDTVPDVNAAWPQVDEVVVWAAARSLMPKSIGSNKIVKIAAKRPGEAAHRARLAHKLSL